MTAPAPPRAVRLTSPELDLRCDPDHGAKVTSLVWRRSGRELLAAGVRPLRAAGADDLWEEHDRGGWDECWPTVSATTTSRPIPCHGDLWRRAWTVATADGDSSSLVTEVAVDAGGEAYVFRRRLRLQGPVLLADYEVRVTGARPLTGLWSMHPLFALPPGGARLRLGGPATARAEHEFGDIRRLWDGAVVPAGLPLDPAMAAAAKLFIDGPAPVAVRYDDCWVALLCRDPHSAVGLWVNAGGWPEQAPLGHIGLEPCLGGATDDAERSRQRGEALTLAPGSSRSWRVELRAGDDDRELERLLSPGGWPQPDPHQPDEERP